uniref:Ion transport domain-containing protein n=1 Tax=Chromera velia CCMP2878 TaxID=1169474 RepID=A0A0G4FI61_9ALVE|eukprot:Cvel_17111.t1-p1 / transcript=Cvel_17111.t1 / gene=Cvel_17111 / organism=Chromera_velia_CCMP2878 / gene_product=hypothetical protein / transcript_product=hypothetical protein / location=Cvel_scaffold1349:30288-31830(+) / protein_length=345 / sequence_SO=supercontig / SO=protein_coding / is_pseudo=false
MMSQGGERGESRAATRGEFRGHRILDSPFTDYDSTARQNPSRAGRQNSLSDGLQALRAGGLKKYGFLLSKLGEEEGGAGIQYSVPPAFSKNGDKGEGEMGAGDKKEEKKREVSGWSRAVSFYNRAVSFFSSFGCEATMWFPTTANIGCILLDAWLSSEIVAREVKDENSPLDEIVFALRVYQIAFLHIYFVEVLVKYAFRPRLICKSFYNWFDLIVALGSEALWLAGLADGRTDGSSCMLESVARKLPVFRIVRPTQVIAFFAWQSRTRELWLLLMALGTSLRILFFGVAIFVLLCLAFGSVITSIVNTNTAEFPSRACVYYTERDDEWGKEGERRGDSREAVCD